MSEKNAERDPRKDPRPGDVLRVDGIDAHITEIEVSGDLTVVHIDEIVDRDGRQIAGFALPYWRLIMSKAEVIHRAD